MDILKRIKNSIIISVQASYGEPFYEKSAIKAMMQACIDGGAKGLRVAGGRDIMIAKSITDLPVIGITKPSTMPTNPEKEVYISPTLQDIETIIKAGADIIAFDATNRTRPDGKEIKDTIALIKKHNLISMADISTLQEGINAQKLGAEIISTTLSGYTEQSLKTNGPIYSPDFDLLKGLSGNLSCPIILEGKIWEPSQVKKAFDLGAYAVVIGSAITRPKLIVERFIDNTNP